MNISEIRIIGNFKYDIIDDVLIIQTNEIDDTSCDEIDDLNDGVNSANGVNSTQQIEDLKTQFYDYMIKFVKLCLSNRFKKIPIINDTELINITLPTFKTKSVLLRDIIKPITIKPYYIKDMKPGNEIIYINTLNKINPGFYAHTKTVNKPCLILDTTAKILINVPFQFYTSHKFRGFDGNLNLLDIILINQQIKKLTTINKDTFLNLNVVITDNFDDTEIMNKINDFMIKIMP